MAGANYMGGKRNAMKARTKDPIGRKQKTFFGRQRLDMLAKGISGIPRLDTTRSVLGAMRPCPEDIALAHAPGRKNMHLEELDASTRNYVPNPVRFSSSAVRSKRPDAHTSSSGRSEILDKLDVSEPLFLRQAMDRILARPDLACLGKRSRKKSHTSPSTSSQPELSSSKQREQRAITALATKKRKVDELPVEQENTRPPPKNQQPQTPPKKKRKVRAKPRRLGPIRGASFSPVESIEDISDWKTSSECEGNFYDSGYVEYFEENDPALSSDSWSVQYHSSSTSRRDFRIAKTPNYVEHSTPGYDPNNGSYQANRQIRAHEEHELDDDVPLAIKICTFTDEQEIGRGMQQHGGSVYGNLFAKPNPWKTIGNILGLEGTEIQDEEAVIHQRTSGDAGSTSGLEEHSNVPLLSDEEYESSCVVQADVFSDEVTSLRLDPQSTNTIQYDIDLKTQQGIMHAVPRPDEQISRFSSDSIVTSVENAVDSNELIESQHLSIEDDPDDSAHRSLDIANQMAGLGDQTKRNRSEDPGSECPKERCGDYNLDEMDYKPEVLAVPGFREVNGRFLAPSIFDE